MASYSSSDSRHLLLPKCTEFPTPAKSVSHRPLPVPVQALASVKQRSAAGDCELRVKSELLYAHSWHIGCSLCCPFGQCEGRREFPKRLYRVSEIDIRQREPHDRRE